MITRNSDEQHRRYDAFAAMAMVADNLGGSDDQRDVYAVFDAMVADMKVGFPEFACQVGCNHCCYTPPMVTSLEWQVLYRYLLALAPEKQLQIVAAAERLRPLASVLRDKLRRTLGQDPGPPPAVGLQCPLLLDGKCSVYGGRPMICRGSGYTVTSQLGKPSFFGSSLAQAHLAERFPKDTVLPFFDPYVQAVGRLNGQQAVQGYLPQWLWAHLRQRTLLPAAVRQPDFL